MSEDFSLIPRNSALRWPLFWILVSVSIVFCFIIGYTIYSYIVDNQEVKIDTKLVNSLSCGDLGSYIIKNSINDSYTRQEGYMSDVYNLAKSKYLVCTHTPSSEMSP